MILRSETSSRPFERKRRVVAEAERGEADGGEAEKAESCDEGLGDAVAARGKKIDHGARDAGQGSGGPGGGAVRG